MTTSPFRTDDFFYCHFKSGFKGATIFFYLYFCVSLSPFVYLSFIWFSICCKFDAPFFRFTFRKHFGFDENYFPCWILRVSWVCIYIMAAKKRKNLNFLCAVTLFLSMMGMNRFYPFVSHSLHFYFLLFYSIKGSVDTCDFVIISKTWKDYRKSVFSETVTGNGECSFNASNHNGLGTGGEVRVVYK